MGGPVEEAFGQVIRSLRLEAGWSQEMLADASHTSRGYISLVERGVNSVTVDMIFRLAGAFGTTPSGLFQQVEVALAAKDTGWGLSEP